MDRYAYQREKDLFVAKPEGEIVSRSYPEFERILMKDVSSRHKFVFNMEKVDFINSQGMVFLLRMREMVEVNGGYFAVYNLTRNVEKVLKRLQLEKVLNVAGDAETCFAGILDRELKRNLFDLIMVRNENPQSNPIPVSVSGDG